MQGILCLGGLTDEYHVKPSYIVYKESVNSAPVRHNYCTERSKMYCIYTLSDPRDGAIRYIGLSKTPFKRFGSHLTTGADPHNLLKKAWIEDLINNEMLPVIKIIERFEDRDLAYIRESELIEEYIEKGVDILNMQTNIINAKNRELRRNAKKALNIIN
jgi:hypothetical protein